MVCEQTHRSGRLKQVANVGRVLVYKEEEGTQKFNNIVTQVLDDIYNTNSG
jgi:hypothetical protein